MAKTYQDFLDAYTQADPVLNPGAFDTSAMPETKAAEVERASQQKRAQLDPNGYVLSTMKNTGSGMASAAQRDRDFVTMTTNQFRQKYGNDIGATYSAAYAQGDSERRVDTQTNRDGLTLIGDGLNSVGMGFINSIGGIGALGAGLVSKDAGVWAAQKLGDLNEAAQSVQSDALNGSRRAYGAKQALDARDNKKEADEITRDYGKTVGSLARFGADVVDSTANSFSTPGMTSDTVASGVGSLFAGGPISKGLRALGGAVVKGATFARPSLLFSETAGKAVSLGSKAAMPAAIGLMEGGGAYQQTVQQAYEQLSGRTDLTEDQKREMANKAGLEAAAIQAPIGALTGTLVSKFESHPLAAPTIRTAAQNILKETVEEGIQSASGQFAQNVGIQQNVDPNQDLMQGVGEQAALGAIGGAGSAGVVQAPSVALRGAVETAKLPFRAAGAALAYRGDMILARNQRVQDEILAGLHDQATAATPEAESQVANILSKLNVSDETKAKVQEFADRTISRLKNSSTIQDIAKVVGDKTAPIIERLKAAADLSSLVQESQNSQDEKTPPELKKSVLGNIKTVVDNIAQSKTVQTGIEKMKELYAQHSPEINQVVNSTLDKLKGKTVQPEDISNADEAVKLVVGMADQSPEKVDPEAVKKILFHSDNGTIKLSPQQRATLRSAEATARAVQTGAELATKYGLANAEAVSREVLTDAPKEGSKLSLSGHLQYIRAAYNAGDTEVATKRLGELRSFAQHLSNKVVSFNDALIGGNSSDKNPVVFKAHVGGGRFENVGQTFIVPQAVRSVKLAQHIAVQARTVAAAVNNLSDALFLNVEHIEPALLDPSLDGDATTVAKEYREGKRLVPGATTSGVETQAADVTVPDTVDAGKVEDQGKQPSNEENVADQPKPEPAKSEQTSDKPSDVVPDVVDAPVEEPAPAVANQEEKAKITEPTPPVQDVPDTVESLYPSLIGSKKNRITVAFKIPKKKSTRTFGVDSPMQTIRDGLKNESTFRELIDGDLNRKYTPEVAKAYSDYFSVGDSILDIMNDRLQTFLKKNFKNGVDESVDWLNGQAMNIVDENDGKYSYNQKLVENAVLASLQWYLKLNQYSGALDDKDVRQLLRLDVDAVLPEGLVDQINDAGSGPAEMARSLAQEIHDFWGLDGRNDVPRNYIEGPVEGVAKEIIESMVELGMLTMTPVDISSVTTDNNILSLNRYQMASVEVTNSRGQTVEQKVISAQHPTREFPTAIEKAVRLDSPEINYIGEPPKKVAKTQLRNQAVDNTPDQIASIEKQQAVPHRLNMPFIQMLEQMGEPGILRLFGGGNTETANLNINHKKTLDGRNLTLQSAFISIQNLVKETKNKASMDGVDVAEMPIHFDYNDTVVNRAQMLGKDNPQSNKLMREAVLPTWKVLDLTDSKTRDQFFMGLAQALGEKVHTQTVDQSIAGLNARLAGFEKTLELMNDDGELRFTPEAIDDMKSEGVSSVAGLHALMEYARYQATEDKSKFRTSIYFEADGVTNGVVNAMALFSSGPFTSQWLNNISLGGYHVGENPASLVQIRGAFPKNAQDLYGLAGTKITAAVQNLRVQYRGQDDFMAQFNAVRDFLDEFMKDISVNADNSLTVERGAVKNPLTITIYGSGAKGIAGNITDEVISKLYERLSEVADIRAKDKYLTEAQAFYGGDKDSAQIKFDRLMRNFGLLVNNRLFTNKGELIVEPIGSGVPKTFGNPKEFTFSRSDIQTIRENVLHAFVTPMVEGITDTVGKDLMDSMNLIKTQVQSWSLLGKYAYQQAYNEALAKKNYKSKNDLLSRDEEEAVFQSVWKQLPYFSTGSQNFLFGMRQSNEIRTEFARSLTEGLRSPAFGYTPDDAGVAGIPGLTIGAGDGQAILNAVNDPEIPEGFLQIFDGIHSSVVDMEKMGLVANRAVFNSWKNNPLAALTDAFNKFVSQVDLSNLTEEQRKALTKSLFPSDKWRVAQTAEAIEGALKSLAADGNETAQKVAERHMVMTKVQSSVDQMAGAASPYQNLGVILSGSPEQKAAAMENLRKAPPEIEPETKDETPKPTFKQVSPGLLAKMMDKAINKLTNDRLTRALVRDVVRSGRVDNYEIHIGSRQEIIDKASDYGIIIPRTDFSGFTDVGSKNIFVVDGNPETILHELIHAATYDAIEAHYAGDEVDADRADAIVRLEALMEEFKNAGLEGKAYQDTLDEMELQAQNGNPASELNEFMAWSLANADLAAQLQKTKVENRAIRLARSVIQMIKKVLWGGKRSAAVKDDLFTNIRFNTNIVMRTTPTEAETASEGILFHSPSFGENARVGNLLGRMKNKLTDYFDTDLATQTINRKVYNRPQRNGVRVAEAFQNAGFNMNEQEYIAFVNMVAIMGTDAQLDPNSTIRMQELFTHVTNNLSVEDFMNDPQQNDPGDILQATNKFNVLVGKFAARKDAYDRSVVLPAFIALASTNEDFRKILKNMEMPKTKYAKWNSVDNILDNVGETSLDNLSRWMSGEGVRTKEVQQALDGLTSQMLDTADEARLFIEKYTSPVGNMIDRANDYVIDAFEWVGDKATKNANDFRAKNPNAKLRNAMNESVAVIANLLNEGNGKASAMGLMSSANQTKVWRPVYDLLKDLIGRTDENAAVYDLIKIARTWVNGIRQQYREQFPRIMNGKFSRELTEQEQTHLYRAVGETNFAALMRGNDIAKVLDLLGNDRARNNEIKVLLDKIGALSSDNLNDIKTKSEQLAKFMVTKVNDQGNLLRNAEAIAHLLGVPGVTGTVTSQQMIDHIDHLVSLLAVNELDTATRDSISSLVQSEAKAMGFMLSYLQGQDELDHAKANGNARFNYFKGHMPSEAAQGVSLIITHDNGAAKLIEKSYKRLLVYSGSDIDPTAKNRGYYFAPVSARAPFSQGITQNVQQTVSGVDKATGFSTDLTAGVITDPALVKRISQSRTKESGFALMPLYDENGNIYAYERSVDPRMTKYLNAKTNMAKAMGIRSGRQVEETLAHDVNKALIDRLHDMWQTDRKKRSGEYVDLYSSLDPIHKDAVKIFSNETRDYIQSRFGNKFMVRKDMIDDAIGYRSASIGDVWTGTSRWSPETQEYVKRVLHGMFGMKAYQYATKAESVLQNVIQDLKVAIVIKSVVVPVSNAASNIFQLLARGVPATQIFRNIPKKTAEIESWHKSRIRQIEAEAELMATTDLLQRRRLEAEIQTIKDAHKRLSIWPLLEAGEFSSISDAGSREDILLTEGKLSEFLEAAVNKLPKSLQTAGKYAIISKDTALFRALEKSVQYGDFIAKAIMYDDLINRQKKTKAEALGRVTEEFINYDRLPGRDRAYLESIGLLWFYNFKIRSSKVAVSMIRNNPVHMLIASVLPHPINGIGLPLEDNFWASLFDGRAANSVGYGMAFRAPGLLPLGNLFW